MIDNETITERFARLFSRIQRFMDRRMTEHGVSLARTKMLMYLDGDEKTRACDIASVFGLAPRTVTEAVDALERSGLVARHPHPTDRRAKRIVVTDSGRQAIASTAPLREQLITQIFGVLTEEEREQFLHILTKLGDAIECEEPSDGSAADRSGNAGR